MWIFFLCGGMGFFPYSPIRPHKCFTYVHVVIVSTGHRRAMLRVSAFLSVDYLFCQLRAWRMYVCVCMYVCMCVYVCVCAWCVWLCLFVSDCATVRNNMNKMFFTVHKSTHQFIILCYRLCSLPLFWKIFNLYLKANFHI